MPVIPFYGADEPELFEIERAAMDRSGRVIAALDLALPHEGLVADVGAGNGFTAARLANRHRTVLALEPSPGMVDANMHADWVRADAEALPIADGSIDALYATWAYFFSRGWDPTPGLAEAHRVTRAGSPLLFVDNLGGDEFSSYAEGDISADVSRWESWGFECTEIETAFEFDSQRDAERLFTRFFGHARARGAPVHVEFRVGLFVGASTGPGR